MELIQKLKEFTTVSIIGMDKNVGKTTTLNHLIKETRGKLTLGLTSIGRDGEDTDRVTFTPKPRIYVESGSILATSKECLLKGDTTLEILKTTGIHTPMGEVIIARCLSDGYVELGGPSRNTDISHVCEEMKSLGCDLVMVDGALSRKTLASPAITEATVLATGATISRSMPTAVEKTAHTYQLLSTPIVEDEKLRELSRQLILKHKVSIIDSEYKSRTVHTMTALEASKEVSEALQEDSQYLVIQGILGDKFVDELIKYTNLYKQLTFIVQDGTKLFLNRENLMKLNKSGAQIRTLDQINIIGLTANPTSPQGYSFDSFKFRSRLKEALGIPIYDVLGGE